jgi:hypothetical protein
MPRLPFHLALRDCRHMVSLIRWDEIGRNRVEIGIPYAVDMDPRQRILELWGMQQGSPRREMSGTLDQPLSRRHQVALSPQLDPWLRQLLRGGLPPEPEGRRDVASGVKSRLHLGVGRSPVANGQPPLGRHPTHSATR